MRRKVVLVSGAPGAGKSTIASQLAPILQVPLVSKDLIKECLWDALDPPSGDLAWSKRLSAASMQLLWQFAEHSPAVVVVSYATYAPIGDSSRVRTDTEA